MQRLETCLPSRVNQPAQSTSLLSQPACSYVPRKATYTRNVWLGSSAIVTLVLLWTILFSPFHVFAASTQAQHQKQATLSYNCTTNPAQTSGHCYAIQSWGGANGADTRILVDASLYGGCCNGDFVDTEMWLITADRNYWVEAGVTSDQSLGNGSNVFWADNRPGGG